MIRHCAKVIGREGVNEYRGIDRSTVSSHIACIVAVVCYLVLLALACASFSPIWNFSAHSYFPTHSEYAYGTGMCVMK